MKKIRDLSIILIIYLIAYLCGAAACHCIDNIILKYFVFDTAATVIVFIFSVILVNSSVYDAYWSLTPMVISIWLFISRRAFSLFQLIFLTVFNLWSVRLTANWITVFTDFGYEDWRYRKFRNETSKPLWPVVNFFGIHYIPTIVVFLGMLPLFRIAENSIGIKSLPGIIVILTGTALEFFADRQMHAFLASGNKGSVCRNGLWKYSRHPNYLGEITVWLGVFLAMIPYSPEHWYCAVGFLSVALLFNVISIPLMETRQKSRRPDYYEYSVTTSRLLILPVKKQH